MARVIWVSFLAGRASKSAAPPEMCIIGSVFGGRSVARSAPRRGFGVDVAQRLLGLAAHLGIGIRCEAPQRRLRR